MNTGERIRMLRSQKHFTLAEVSRQIGMTPAGLSLIELGKRRVTTEQIELLAKALGARPADFFDAELNAATRKHKEAPADA